MKRMLVAESIVILERYFSYCYELGPFTSECQNACIPKLLTPQVFSIRIITTPWMSFFLKIICDFSMDEYGKKS